MGRLENAKDKAMGKIMEASGKITQDPELEFSGKFQTLTSNVKDKFYDVKEDVVQEANEIVDKANKAINRINRDKDK